MTTILMPSVSFGHILLFLFIGLCFKLLRRFPWLYLAVSLPGTLAHEGLHYFAGLAFYAKPVSLSLRPRRTSEGHLIYGEVIFARLRWWNKVPVGLAPLLLIPLSLWLFYLACFGKPMAWRSLFLMLMVWECLLSSMPSFQDMLHVMSGVKMIVVLGISLILALAVLGRLHI